MTVEVVRTALGDFGRLYACLTPFERKELIKLILRRAEVGVRQVALELYPIQAQEMEAPRAVHALSHQTGSPDWFLRAYFGMSSRSSCIPLSDGLEGVPGASVTLRCRRLLYRFSREQRICFRLS